MVLNFLLLGVSVSVHWTTIFLFLVFFVHSFLYLRKNLEGENITGYLIAGFFSVILIIFSIFIHEISHAIVAENFGFRITSAGINGAFAYVSNGLSINSIEPYKVILIAIAGPFSNFLLALIGMPIIYFLGHSLSGSSLRYFSMMNIRLGRINLWPILGLDGGLILNSLIKSALGSESWTSYIAYGISIIFIVYLIKKKKDRFELEHIVDKIP